MSPTLPQKEPHILSKRALHTEKHYRIPSKAHIPANQHQINMYMYKEPYILSKRGIYSQHKRTISNHQCPTSQPTSTKRIRAYIKSPIFYEKEPYFLSTNALSPTINALHPSQQAPNIYTYVYKEP